MDSRLVQIEPAAEHVSLLSEGVNTIGRDTKNTLQLASDSVSRYHARITKTGEKSTVEDLNSSNGTFVNKSKITSARLNNGDLVTFGTITFRYEEGQMTHGSSAHFIPRKFSHQNSYATVRIQKPTLVSNFKAIFKRK